MKSKKNPEIQELREYLKTYGKTHSWAELADMFNVFQDRSKDRKGEAVRSIFRRLKNKTTESTETSENLVLKKRWFNGSQWCESFENVDAKDITNEFNEIKNSFLQELRDLNHTKEIARPIKDENQYYEKLVELAIPDFHFGKIDGSTIEEQAELFETAVFSLLDKFDFFNSEGMFDRVVFPLGNDFFNVDNLNYTTTKGTQQRDNSHWQKSFATAWKTVIKVIEEIKQICPIDVLMIPGNHDFERNFYLGEVLEAYYLNDENVNIDNSLESPRKYYLWNHVLIGYTHGDKEKLQELPLIMATEAPELWAQSKCRNIHTGHLHKVEVSEVQGVNIRVMPALCGQDEWHKQMGYNSTRKAQCYIYNPSGLDGYFQYNYNE